MTTVSQLPIASDVVQVNGTHTVHTVPLGVDLTGHTLVAYVSVSYSNGQEVGNVTFAQTTALSTSVISTQQGIVSVVFPAGILAGNDNFGVTGAKWTLYSTRASAENPALAIRTLAVGSVTRGFFQPDAANYLKIVMFSGDEFTFQASAGRSLVGLSSIQAGTTWYRAALDPGDFIVSVVSAAQGVIKVTVPEIGWDRDTKFWAAWGFGSNGLEMIMGGPIVLSGAVAEQAGSQPLGDVFL
jgi:hypothetical protein